MWLYSLQCGSRKERKRRMNILAVSITFYCVIQNAIGPDVQRNKQGKASRKAEDRFRKQQPPEGSGKQAAIEAALMEPSGHSSLTGPKRELLGLGLTWSCKTFEWSWNDYWECNRCSSNNLFSYKNFKKCLYEKGVVPGASNRALPTSATFALPLLITMFSLYNSVSSSASNYDPHQVSPVAAYSCATNEQDQLAAAFEDLAEDDGKSVPLERVEEALLKLGFSKGDIKKFTSSEKDNIDFDSFHTIMSNAILDKRIQKQMATDFISDKNKNKVSTEKLISFLWKAFNEHQREEIQQLVIGNDNDGDGDLDEREMAAVRMMLGLKLDGIDPCDSRQP